MEPTQEELDNAITDRHEAERKKELVYKHEAMEIVKAAFHTAETKLKIRSTYDQTVIGNMLTVIESEIKNDIKKLKSQL